MLSAIDRATELTELGFRVFPLGRLSKKPAEDWKKYQDGEHWDELEAKLATLPPDVNLGIVTGLNVVVVDADNAEQVAFVEENLTKTPMRVKTSKGKHFYYKTPDFDTANIGSKTGIDFRGRGGYVVAEGSIHETGVVYELELDFECDAHDLPTITEVDLTKLRAYNRQTGEVGEIKETNVTFEPVQEGGRNVAAASLAGAVIQKGHPLSTVKQVLDHWNQSNPVPLSSDELNMTIASVAKTHTNAGREPIPLIGQPQQAAQTPQRMKVYNAAELGELARPADFIIGGILESDGIGILGGSTGSFKSFIALEMCHCIATGRPFFGNPIMRQGASLYVAGEGAGGLGRRVRALNSEYEVATDFFSIPKGRDLGNQLVRLELVQLIKEIQPEIVVFDTFNQLAPSVENNSSKEVSAMMQEIRQMVALAESKASVIIVHHAGKGDPKNLEGTHAFISNSDFAFIAAKQEEGGTAFSCMKQKDYQRFEPMHLKPRLVELGIGSDYNGAECTSFILDSTSTPLHQRAAPKGGKVSKSVKRCIHDAVVALYHEQQQTGANDPVIQVSDIKKWMAAHSDKKYHPKYMNELVKMGAVIAVGHGGYRFNPLVLVD